MNFRKNNKGKIGRKNDKLLAQTLLGIASEK